MLDPTDIALVTGHEGDAETLPTPTGGPDGTPAQGDVASPTIRMCVLFALDLAVGAEQPCRANDLPDYWSVSLSTTATGTISIWPYEAASGPPVRLEAGGEAVVPGQAQSLVVRNTGPIVAKVNVLAVRGYDGVRTKWGS